MGKHVHVHGHRATALDAWVAIERFESQTLRRLSPHGNGASGGTLQLDVPLHRPLPWEVGHPAFGRTLQHRSTEWRHGLLLGRFDLGAAYDRVEQLFPGAEESRERRKPTSLPAPLLSIALTTDGRPDLATLQISSAAWSLATTLKRGVEHDRWLVDFEVAEDELRASFAGIVIAAAQGASKEPAIDAEGCSAVPLDWPQITAVLDAADRHLELSGQLAIERTVRTSTWAQKIGSPRSSDAILNSFAVRDLQRIQPYLSELRSDTALAAYLDGSTDAREPADRVDTDTDLGAVEEQSAPHRIPAGRWPANPKHDLALGQQLAVNLALAEAAAPITAVNGPPGTGKTTMLRDLIAGHVVERAVEIAKLTRASEAFGNEVRCVVDGEDIRVHAPVPQLAGRELLLACATNAAAKNVSLELPDVGAVDAAWRSATDPRFAGLATSALISAQATDLRGGDGVPPSAAAAAAAPEAWALVAARLGKREYRKGFAQAVWWGTDASAEPGLWRLLGGQRKAQAPPSTHDRPLPTAAEANAAWRAAKAHFSATHASVEVLRAERTAIDDAFVALRQLPEVLRAAEACAAEVGREYRRLEKERDAWVREIQALEAARDAQDARLVALGGPTPTGRWRRLRAAGRAREAARLVAAAAASEAARRVAEGHRAQANATHELESAARAVQLASADVEATSQALRNAEIATAGPYPFAVPSDAWDEDAAERDQRALWTDPVWNAARSECFVAALDLHTATVMACRGMMRKTLRVAFELVAGRPAGLSHDVILAAWQTLFLLVPVVSTTFASLPSLLAGLEAEDLGCVLIDEAGQATPQQAVGALWRCRRAVIVGDPLQLEPVSGVPSSLAEAIRVRCGAGQAYVSPQASVQRLADATMQWGSRRGDEHLWVGVPLNVHRRCQRPIFDLVNEIAYAGRMVCATGPSPAHAALNAPSSWLDVTATSRDDDGHWRAAEGKRLQRVLDHLRAGGFDLREVFVVTPFRDVADELNRRHLDQAAGPRGGTIHTIQGMEADVVVLVLGGAASRPGAKQWATSKPNLLNVAVSRARHRLYVIGDREAWIDLPYIADLAGLPVRPHLD